MRASDLSRSEKLWLNRKRQGQNMAAAAAEHGVSIMQYRRWERGEDETGIPNVAVGKLTETDQFMLLRRRAGKSIRDIAASLGKCPWWVRQMERGEANNEPLKKYWKLSA